MKNRIKNRVLNAAAFVIFAKEQFQLSEAEIAYNKQIAESQAKIGPYVHHNCPVQIWA
jgi:hypothetical protein